MDQQLSDVRQANVFAAFYTKLETVTMTKTLA